MLPRAAALLALLLGRSAAAPPHIIFSLVDDLGSYNVGWRNANATSPNIDRLARGGTLLARHYAYKFCSPTRSALLSGRLPLHVNEDNPATIDSVGGVDLRMALLPQRLKAAADYYTVAIGKWHLGARQRANLPGRRGFDHHFGFLTGGEDHFTQVGYEAANAIDLWAADASDAAAREGGAPALDRNGTYSCELYAAEAARVVMAHDPSRPLFLYQAWHDTHAPYEAPERYADGSIAYADRRVMQAMVACVDEGTGNLTAALDARGMWENTLLVWSADNGGPQYWNANNYPYRGGKGTDFEGGVRAAAFVAGGFLPAAAPSEIAAPIHVCDWYATFLKLAGVGDPADPVDGLPDVDAVDVWPLFAAPASAAALAPPRSEVPLSSMALIVGDFKLVTNTTVVLGVLSGYWTGPVWPFDDARTPLEADPGCPLGGCLFNITADPTEHDELSARLPDKRRELVDRLAELVAGRYQTAYEDPDEQNCTTLAEYVATHAGFAGPVCA
jgi:arylsulfatase B